MAKKQIYERVELVIPVDCKGGSAYRISGKGSEKITWESGDNESTSRAGRRAEELAQAIKSAIGRYEEEVCNYEVRYVPAPVCEHCGSKWTENSSAYNGGCCDEDQSAHEQAADSNNSAEVET